MAPSSFWAVSVAQQPGDENMAETTMDINFSSMEMKPQYPRGAAPKGAANSKAKNPKITPLSVRFPIYVNTKHINVDRGMARYRAC